MTDSAEALAKAALDEARRCAAIVTQRLGRDRAAALMRAASTTGLSMYQRAACAQVAVELETKQEHPCT